MSTLPDPKSISLDQPKWVALVEFLKHEYAKSYGALEGDVTTSLPIEMADS